MGKIKWVEPISMLADVWQLPEDSMLLLQSPRQGSIICFHVGCMNDEAYKRLMAHWQDCPDSYVLLQSGTWWCSRCNSDKCRYKTNQLEFDRLAGGF